MLTPQQLQCMEAFFPGNSFNQIKLQVYNNNNSACHARSQEIKVTPTAHPETVLCTVAEQSRQGYLRARAPCATRATTCTAVLPPPKPPWAPSLGTCSITNTLLNGLQTIKDVKERVIVPLHSKIRLKYCLCIFAVKWLASVLIAMLPASQKPT